MNCVLVEYLGNNVFVCACACVCVSTTQTSVSGPDGSPQPEAGPGGLCGLLHQTHQPHDLWGHSHGGWAAAAILDPPHLLLTNIKEQISDGN